MHSNLYLAFILICVYISNIGVLGFGYFWHISDTHVDQNYSRTGNVFNMCHRDRFSFPDNGIYGNFLCDSPQYLVNASVHAMRTLHEDPDFIIWTGDNLPHTTRPDPDWEATFEAILNTTELISSTFPNVTILPCIGNHDAFPPDQLLPSGPVYEGYLKKGGWKQLLSEEAQSTFLKGGFYSHLIKPGLRIISLNTILWYSPNAYTADLVDPATQLWWLEDLLNTCSQNSEKVYIIGHVPPGFYNRMKPGEKSAPTYHPQYLKKYLFILNKFSEIILGQLYGHYHMDMFQVFQYDTGTYKGSSLLASSVTPWHGMDAYNVSIPVNPSIRLLKYSDTNFTLLDYHQFYLNLTRANNNPQQIQDNRTLFEPLYTFTEVYDVPDLSTQSLVQAYEKIKSDEHLFDTFFKLLTAMKESVVCDSSCKTAQLCSMSSSSEAEYNSCMETENYYIVAVVFLVVLIAAILVYCGLPHIPCKKPGQYKLLNENRFIF